MNVLQNISFEHNREITPCFIGCDIEKHGEVFMPIMDKIGVTPNNEEFEKERAMGISGKELKRRIHQRIDNWQWKEK